MMQINFIFGVSDRINTACHVIDRLYLSHKNIVIYSNEYETLCKIDKMIWTFKDVSFIPHSFYYINNNLNKEFIVITSDISKSTNIKNNEMLLINMSNIIPLCYNEFEGLVEIVSENEQDKNEARSRWRLYKKNGHILSGYHFNDFEYPKKQIDIVRS